MHLLVKSYLAFALYGGINLILVQVFNFNCRCEDVFQFHRKLKSECIVHLTQSKLRCQQLAAVVRNSKTAVIMMDDHGTFCSQKAFYFLFLQQQHMHIQCWRSCVGKTGGTPLVAMHGGTPTTVRTADEGQGSGPTHTCPFL